MSREYKLHSMGEGWWQVCGVGELRHEVFGTVQRVYAGQWFAAAGDDTRTYTHRGNAAQWVADQWKPEDENKAPVQVSHLSWQYKGWTFHVRLDHENHKEYAVHGPRSNGKRARKIVFRMEEAVAYIDGKVR